MDTSLSDIASREALLHSQHEVAYLGKIAVRERGSASRARAGDACGSHVII
jgi:hypothetical protein